VGRRLAVLLRQLGHDVVHSQEIGMKYEPDDAQLFIAAQDNRILVTKNGEDFALLHRAWQRWSAAWGVNPTHAGILIIAADGRISMLHRASMTLLTVVTSHRINSSSGAVNGIPNERHALLDTLTARAHNR
jgi:hypothetical protein